MPKKRLIFFVTHSLADGGTDRVAVHLANGCAAQTPTILFQAALTCAPEKSVAHLLEPEVKHILARRFTIGRSKDLIAALPLLVRTLKQEKPSHLVSTGNNNSIVTALAHLIAGRKNRSFSIKITNPVKRKKGHALNKAIRTASYAMMFALADQIWALSSAEAVILKRDFPSSAHKISVVANPYVSQDMLDVGTARLNRMPPDAAHSKRVIAVGRLHFQKNYPLLIDAWALLQQSWQGQGPKPHLWIIGEGPDRAKLEEKIRQFGLQDNILLKGFQHDIPNILKQADLMVLSSDYEGLPAVALEALAAGLPVVSTNSFPAAQGLLGGEPGCAVTPLNDADGLAAAIQTSLQQPANNAQLMAKAMPYQIEKAIESHMAKLV